jgi:hypothetical protein
MAKFLNNSLSCHNHKSCAVEDAEVIHSFGRGDCPQDNPAFFSSYPRRKFFLQSKIETFNDELEVAYIERQIALCPDMPYVMAVCGDCRAVIHSQAFKRTCGIRLCPNCVIDRVRHSKLRLNSYGIRARQMIHFSISFLPSAILSRAEKKVQERVMCSFYREMKKLGSPVQAFRVFDVKKDKLGFKLHYHHGQMPVADIDKFIRNAKKAEKTAGEKTGLKFHVEMHGWRAKGSLFKYFSKSMAGLYSTEGKHHKANLCELISTTQYVRFFKKARSMVCINLPASVLKGAERKLVLADSCKDSPVFSNPCPICGSKNIWALSYQEYVDRFEEEPPPGLDKGIKLEIKISETYAYDPRKDYYYKI